MSDRKEKSVSRVAEPVQVYLKPADQDRLARLTEHLDTSKSDVLRRGLEALEREVTDPATHPVLRLIGMGASSEPGGGPPAPDPARDHDAVLARSEERSWGRSERRGEDGGDGA